MKKTIVAAILGIAAVANTFGQGTIIFDNYSQGTYNQVVWGPNHPAGRVTGAPVTDPITLTLYYASGAGITDMAAMTQGLTVQIDPSRLFVGNAGPGGWFSGGTQTLPTWSSGQTFSFGISATAGFPGISGTAFWNESSNIHVPAAPQFGFANFPGLTVNIPEPSTFALAGLGSAAMLIFRRRKV